MMQERHVAAIIAALLVRKNDGGLPSDGQIHVAVNKAWEVLRWASGADRRKADRRVRDVPVSIDRRTGPERRMTEREDHLAAEAAEISDG
jgi:hypothetical protein